MIDYKKLEHLLHYTFKNIRLLEQALTHKSSVYENPLKENSPQKHNERLEFLGDAILQLTISDLLYRTFHDLEEGALTKRRAQLVCQDTLAQLASSLNIADYMLLGKGEIKTGGVLKPSILSSAFEAMIASIFLDGGYLAVTQTVHHIFTPFLKQDQKSTDYKSELQEKIQLFSQVLPVYFLVSTEGPEHLKKFKIQVFWKNHLLGEEEGFSKKQAEQNAAKRALNHWDFFLAKMSKELK
jgi:ribonuclease-3